MVELWITNLKIELSCMLYHRALHSMLVLEITEWLSLGEIAQIRGLIRSSFTNKFISNRRVVRGALKLRYLLLGGAITGGVTLNKVSRVNFVYLENHFVKQLSHISPQRYEEWKDGLPDMKWLEDIFPDNQQWKQFSKDLALVTKSVGESIEIGEFWLVE